MKLLLDTHILLWWIDDDPRLSATTVGAVESAENEVWVSIASLWEVAVKVRTGKMKVDLRHIEREIAMIGFAILPITTRHLEALVSLPMHHRNPFDHLLIAQAIVEQAKLVTRDRYIRAYPVETLG